MINSQSVTTSSEAVAVFEDAETLQAAIDELQSFGFDRAELSLLAGENAVEEKLTGTENCARGSDQSKALIMEEVIDESLVIATGCSSLNGVVTRVCRHLFYGGRLHGIEDTQH